MQTHAKYCTVKQSYDIIEAQNNDVLAWLQPPRTRQQKELASIMDNTVPQNTSDSNLIKRCTACEKEFPATTEFFGKQKHGKYGLRSTCKACRSKEGKAYWKRPEVQAHRQAYKQRSDIKERHKAYNKVYRSHPEVNEHRKAHGKAYYSQAEVKEHYKAYHHDPETHKRILAWRKIYYKRPEVHQRYRAYKHMRRARRNSALGTYTSHDIQKQYERQKGKCYWCGQKKLAKYHVDHVIPLSRGGSNRPDNLVIACPTCNLRKHNKLPHEWIEGGRLL